MVHVVLLLLHRRRRSVVSSLQKFRTPSSKTLLTFFGLHIFLCCFFLPPEHCSRPTMASAPWGEMDLELKYVNGSNCLSRNESDCGLSAPSSGLSTALASVLIFTIVVDILGNVLVILSVYRNKKLRNAGERQIKKIIWDSGIFNANVTKWWK